MLESTNKRFSRRSVFAVPIGANNSTELVDIVFSRRIVQNIIIRFEAAFERDYNTFSSPAVGRTVTRREEQANWK